MGVSDLLARLERVRQSGPSNWRAMCPAHVSKHRSQSLQVSERSDGSIGVHCFAGCEVGAVMDAVGLTVSDLFERPVSTDRRRPSRMFSPQAALECLAEEGGVLLMAGAMLLENQTITEADWQRMSVAQGRINSAWELCRGR